MFQYADFSQVLFLCDDALKIRILASLIKTSHYFACVIDCIKLSLIDCCVRSIIPLLLSFDSEKVNEFFLLFYNLLCSSFGLLATFLGFFGC